jgi:hypothetical protein
LYSTMSLAIVRANRRARSSVSMISTGTSIAQVCRRRSAPSTRTRSGAVCGFLSSKAGEGVLARRPRRTGQGAVVPGAPRQPRAGAASDGERAASHTAEVSITLRNFMAGCWR